MDVIFKPDKSMTIRQQITALLTLWFALSAACHEKPAAPSAANRARIVSAGAAVTETLYALGAGDEVVAVDTTSLYPEAATLLPKVGYLRTLAAEGILGLTPTLVLLSDEAGPPTVVDQLRGAGLRVEVLAAQPSAEGVRARIQRIGELIGRDASQVLAKLDADLARAKLRRQQSTTHPKVVVLYAHGVNTVHVFGKNTPADAIVQLAGAENAITGFEGTKPLTPEALALAAPDVIVLPGRAPVSYTHLTLPTM
jgi:iron complex transport system substrate-binding protein